MGGWLRFLAPHFVNNCKQQRFGAGTNMQLLQFQLCSSRLLQNSSCSGALFYRKVAPVRNPQSYDAYNLDQGWAALGTRA